MKKINTVLSIIGVSVCLVLCSSCKKLLEIPKNVPGQLTTDQIFIDSAATVSSVVGIYVSAFSTNSPLSQFMSLYPSLSSDELNTSNTGLQPYVMNALTVGNSSSQNGSPSFIWDGFYNNNLIYQANAAIEGISTSVTLSPTLKNQLIGECEVIRALSYFYLVNLYGPVPLAVTTNYNVNSRLPRASVDVIYTQIIKDLVNASDRLNANYPSEGRARPNKFTAMALLSRVYLYRKEWDKALSTSSSIINSGIYNIEAVPNVFHIGSQESIWQAVTVGGFDTYATFTGNTFVPYDSGLIPEFYLTESLINEFETDDSRLTNWIASNTVEGINYYYPYKYKNRYDLQVNGTVEGEVIFRLAEQYLIRAESRIQLGDLIGGAEDLDIIRNRADLLNTTATSKDDLLEAVAHERKIELFCEWGHRWFDLKRTDKINAVMNEVKNGVWPLDGHTSYYPISYNQLILNPGWQQNSGY